MALSLSRPISQTLTQAAVIVGLILWFCAPFARAQGNPSAVSVCELASTPKNFDGKLVRVRGRLNVHFEDFSLAVGKCNAGHPIWLAFGGDVPGIVPSTVNDTSRQPGSDLKINGVPYGVEKDANFRRLYALITSRHGGKRDYAVTASLIGTFLAGQESKDGTGNVVYGGYGHLGCCSLLVITQVSDVESVPSANLDLHGVVIGPDGKPLKGLIVIDDILGGAPPERQTTVTNELGKFAFSDSGQQLRIENPKFRPLALAVEPGGAAIRVRLQDAAPTDWIPATCSSSVGRIGFSVLFALPETMESSRSDDNEMRSFFVYPKGKSDLSAELFISHSAHAMTDAGDSLDFRWFNERWIKDTAGKVIGIDARGRMKDGSYRRMALFFGHDTAGYRLGSGENLDAPDQIIDSACLPKIAVR